ncbi:MAG: sigma-70 family RNA polymerase sigma factor [Phycisphaerales bacterium]|nr:sigma-70 family RNA polymerase sigma factor [Phycisphaerales bacterium]
MSHSSSSDGHGMPAGFAEEVYDDLHRIAGQYLRGERADHTLQPTALIHEAYLKIARKENWKSATHFRAVASNAMRQILVDHARRRGRLKRKGGRVMLTNNLAVQRDRDLEVIALDEALQALAEFDQRKVRVVELRFFGGLTSRESAQVLGISQKTVEADWYFARAWLHARLDTERPRDERSQENL